MKQLIYTLLAVLFVALAPASTFAQSVKNTNVSISEKDGFKKITIKKTLEDGTIDVINWEGTGEIPEDIKKEMEKGGAFSIHTGKGDFKFISNDSVRIGGDHKFLFIENKEINGELDQEIELIIEQAKDGKVIKDDNNVKIIRLDKDAGNEDLQKEIKVIVEQAENGNKVEGVENISIFRIDKEGEVELGKEDVDIRIKEIGEEGTEKQVEIVFEQDDNEQKVHKLVVIKRVEVEEIIEETAPESSNKVNSEAVDLAPQVLERSLELQDFQISPNPASEMVNLSFKGNRTPTTIRVLGIDGKQLYKEFIRDFSGVYQNNIDLKDINANFVIVNIEQDGKIYSEKLAVKR